MTAPVCPRCSAEILIGNRCAKCLLSDAIAVGAATSLSGVRADVQPVVGVLRPDHWPGESSADPFGEYSLLDLVGCETLVGYRQCPCPTRPYGAGVAARGAGSPFVSVMANAELHTGQGVFGLARVTGDEIEILSIVARRAFTGAGGRFLALLCLNYRTVTVWEIINPILDEMLERRGFLEIDEIVDEERSLGRRWTRP